MAKYKLTNIEVIFREDGACIPKDERNADYVEYLAWVEAGNIPDSPEPIAPESPYREFDRPVKAPDFIVATPPIKDDPELALDEAIAEMEKGQGNPKSIALIALSMAKYLKSKKAKLK